LEKNATEEEFIRKSHREKEEAENLRPISIISVNSVANIRIGIKAGE
jgi:hypothetical protein